MSIGYLTSCLNFARKRSLKSCKLSSKCQKKSGSLGQNSCLLAAECQHLPPQLSSHRPQNLVVCSRFFESDCQCCPLYKLICLYFESSFMIWDQSIDSVTNGHNRVLLWKRTEPLVTSVKFGNERPTISESFIKDSTIGKYLSNYLLNRDYPPRAPE